MREPTTGTSPRVRGYPGRRTGVPRSYAHVALLACVLAVSAIGYFILPQRTVRVRADGQEVVLRTHSGHDVAVVGQAGFELREGDRLTALEGEDADVLQVERPREVILVADGQRTVMRTHAGTIQALLDEADIQLDDRDSLLREGLLAPVTATIAPQPFLDGGLEVRAGPGDGIAAALAAPVPEAEEPIEIEVRRAVPFTINDGGREIISTTSRPTVAQALREAGVYIGPGDRVTPAIDERLVADARIEIARANAVVLALPNEHRVLYTFAPTVGDVLRESGVTLGEGSFVDPPEDAAVANGMSVRVVELSSAADYERIPVPSGVVYREDPSLAAGRTRVVEGHDGVLVRRYTIEYVNGEEAGRSFAEEYYDPEPQDTVIYYPPRRVTPPAAPAPVRASPATGGRTLTVYATWYNPASSGRSPSDPAYGRTATGVQVTYGIVAVDPTVIPLGTRMYIPGYGEAIAADTGGAVKGYIIDLGYPDGVAVDWQSRWVEIIIYP